VKREGFVPALTDPTRVEQLNEAITGNTIRDDESTKIGKDGLTRRIQYQAQLIKYNAGF
jgi:hypothetical protein